MTEIYHWGDREPVRHDLDDYAPGGDLWPRGYDQNLELDPAYDLGGLLPFAAKRVVINDYLPPGQLFVTENEVILSKIGWETLVAYIQLKNECNVAVRRIVEREMGDVLTWLREAGHEV